MQLSLAVFHLERFLSGMLADVGSQNAGRRESFAAVDTLVRTLAAVNLQTHRNTSHYLRHLNS